MLQSQLWYTLVLINSDSCLQECSFNTFPYLKPLLQMNIAMKWLVHFRISEVLSPNLGLEIGYPDRKL